MKSLRSALIATRDRYRAYASQQAPLEGGSANAQVASWCADELDEILHDHHPRLVRIDARDLQPGDVYLGIVAKGEQAPTVLVGQTVSHLLAADAYCGGAVSIAFASSTPDETPPRVSEPLSVPVWAVIG